MPELPSKISSIVNSDDDETYDENGESIKQIEFKEKVPINPEREIKQKTKKVKNNIDNLIKKCKLNERLG
jgi:hypothetical protein